MAKLHSENVTKSTENHRLLRNVKKVTQELNDLKKEKLRLERDLEEAHQEGSRGARTIHVSPAYSPDITSAASGVGPAMASSHREMSHTIALFSVF